MDIKMHKNIRQAYIGGRNEYISEPLSTDKLYSIDFNTMYLNCMGTKFLSGKISCRKINDLVSPGFYHIKYEAMPNIFPVLYMKNMSNNQAYFCSGVSEGLFWYEEIKLFKAEGGKIIEIVCIYEAEHYTENFRPFLEKIHEIKDKKTRKLLANSLYGRLAMKDYKYSVALVTDLEFYLLEAKGVVKR